MQSFNLEYPKNLKEYLEPTYYADSDSEYLRNCTLDVVKGAKTPREAAVKIYHFARDEILFATGGDVGKKASQTLKTKKGPSLLKGSLMIAMLRAAGIPARYRLIDADESKVRGIVDDLSYKLFPLMRVLARNHVILHIIPQVYLDGIWLDADPLFDKNFFAGLKRRRVAILKNVNSIDWDGTTNISPQNNFIKKELGVFANADKILRDWTRGIRYLYYTGLYYPFDRYIINTRKRRQ